MLTALGLAGLVNMAMLASGVSSSSVGTYAGEVVMAGFVRLQIPLLARRAVTMLPALAILAAGANPTSALVLTQVVLSFGIPFALVPLVILTSRRDVMGRHVNRGATMMAGAACAAVIIALNVLPLSQQFRWSRRRPWAAAWCAGSYRLAGTGRYRQPAGPIHTGDNDSDRRIRNSRGHDVRG
jgi:Mn2+/Fe2+ NRAMP family transporter